MSASIRLGILAPGVSKIPTAAEGLKELRKRHRFTEIRVFVPEKSQQAASFCQDIIHQTDIYPFTTLWNLIYLLHCSGVTHLVDTSIDFFEEINKEGLFRPEGLFLLQEEGAQVTTALPKNVVPVTGLVEISRHLA